MHVLIHCSGGGALGVGHVVRSYALAEEAVGRGHRVTFAGEYEGGFVEGLLADLAVEVHRAPTDLATLTRQLEPDVVHVDSYAPLQLEPGRALLSNVEDGAFGRRPADVVIDPNFGAEAQDRPDTPALLLAGARYAPLRADVAALRGRAERRASASRVLVVMGGTDPHALTPRAVAALAGTGLDLAVTVVAPVSRHPECRRAASASSRLRLELLAQVTDLPYRMVEHDVVVSAAGTSVWELCGLGLPMALVCAVDNQRPGYERVVGAGAAVGLGERLLDVEGATRALGELLLDAPRRAEIADRASRIVDGRGAWRIVGAWEQLSCGLPDPVTAAAVETRPATVDDAELLFRWRNDPDTRAASRTTDPVPFEAHVRWLGESVEREDRLLLVGADERGDVGTVRWDRRGEDSWEVSITVAPSRRGAGMARQLLAAGEVALLARVGGPVLCLAAVRRDNQASRHLFTRSGYLLEVPVDAEGFELFARQLTATRRGQRPAGELV